MSPQQINNQGGYTLIELLTVVTIIGILASIAIPNYRGYRDKAKMVTMVSTLRQLRLAEEVYFTDYQKYFPDAGDVSLINQTDSIEVPGLNMEIMLPHGQTYSVIHPESISQYGYIVHIATNFDRNQNGTKDQYLYKHLTDSNGSITEESKLLPMSPFSGT
ncbi:MAG: hypothetical protein B6I36_00405 [Desulfobacteraceae bacterium 4572_35.1]|nr:MAG: hypothetical protein B6I36_00405 [Desulfobacteraceae bacterium 4572_35.1]